MGSFEYRARPAEVEYVGPTPWWALCAARLRLLPWLPLACAAACLVEWLTLGCGLLSIPTGVLVSQALAPRGDGSPLRFLAISSPSRPASRLGRPRRP